MPKTLKRYCGKFIDTPHGIFMPKTDATHLVSYEFFEAVIWYNC